MGDTPKRPSQDNSSGEQEQTPGDKKRARAAKRERSRWRWVWFGVKTVIILIGGAIVLGLGAGTGYAAALLKGLPSITANTFKNTSQPSVVYDKNGNVIGKFEELGNRAPLKNLNDVSPNLVNAFIAAEDRTFWTNMGINPTAMARAFFQDITTHHIESGASTITQQTVKLSVFPQQQRTVKRKVQEIALALKVNKMLTKQEIMTDYMNWVYMGNLGTNVYGVQAASQILFHKSVKDLNLAESTILAAIPNNAYYYSPYIYTNKKGWQIDLTHVQKRQHYILGQMLQHGIITQSQYNTAIGFDIKKDIHLPQAQTINQKYPYLMQDEIPVRVVKALGYPDTAQGIAQAKNMLATSGYKIYTTIDTKVQDHVKQVLDQSKWYKNTLLKNYKVRDNNGKVVATIPYNQYQFGATILDNKTGGIIAIGGGNPNQAPGVKDDVDHSDVPRQPGSSIKPILDYGPAIDMHILTAASPLNDAQTVFHLSDGKTYMPHDAEYGWRGIVSARTALVQSYNVPAVEVLDTVGISNAVKYMAKMNIKPGVTALSGRPTWDAGDSHLSSAIGGLDHGLTTQQMASAYTVFTNQGVFKPAYMISKITNASGQPVYQHTETVKQVFSPQTAYVLDSIMRDVVLHGTATLIGQHFGSTPVYGKTGTTDHEGDGWFIGFTQDYTTALWSGYDYLQRIPTYAYNRKFYVWNALMDPLVKSEHPKPISKPSGVVTANVCKYSGQAPTALCKSLGGTYNEIFIKGTEPTQQDQMYEQLDYTVINGHKYLATTNTPPAQVQVGVFLKPPSQLNFGIFQHPSFTFNTNVSTQTSKYYAPTKPDPAGGTVLPPLSNTQVVNPPSAPQNLTGTAQSSSSVQLQWSAVSGADSYTVYRATSANGPYTQVTTSPVTTTSYVDTTVPQGTQTVYYEVYAIANQVRSTTPSSPLQVTLTAIPGGSGGGQTGSSQTGNTTQSQQSTG